MALVQHEIYLMNSRAILQSKTASFTSDVLDPDDQAVGSAGTPFIATIRRFTRRARRSAALIRRRWRVAQPAGDVDGHLAIPGWSYSIMTALETGRSSWTAPLDIHRLTPGQTPPRPPQNNSAE
jgi:hypothetical protein